MKYSIRIWPDGKLRYVCKQIESVEHIDADVLAAMARLGWERSLLGIAANQVGHDYCMCLIRQTALGHSYWEVMINPKIVRMSAEKTRGTEQCASLPGLEVSVQRPLWVEVEYYDTGWVPQKAVFAWPQSAVVCHELDHLAGVLIADYIPQSQREETLRRWLAERRKVVTNVPG